MNQEKETAIESQQNSSDLALSMKEKFEALYGDQFIVEAAQVLKSGALAEVKKENLHECFRRLFAAGLTPRAIGVLAHAFSVETKKGLKLVFILDYSHFMNKIRAMIGFRRIITEVVREGEQFSYDPCGVHPIEHTVSLSKGAIIGAYCAVECIDNQGKSIWSVEVLSVADLPNSFSGKDMWKDNFHMMLMKQAIRNFAAHKLGAKGDTAYGEFALAMKGAEIKELPPAAKQSISAAEVTQKQALLFPAETTEVAEPAKEEPEKINDVRAELAWDAVDQIYDYMSICLSEAKVKHHTVNDFCDKGKFLSLWETIPEDLKEKFANQAEQFVNVATTEES